MKKKQVLFIVLQISLQCYTTLHYDIRASSSLVDAETEFNGLTEKLESLFTSLTQRMHKCDLEDFELVSSYNVLDIS